MIDAIGRRRRERARDAEAAALAAERGWRLDLRTQTHEAVGGYPLAAGHRRRSARTLVGELRGRPVRAFDYSFRYQDSLLSLLWAPDRWTVAATHIGAGEPLPPTLVVPEGRVRRLLGRATGLDVDLESEAFNRAFTVVGQDRRFVSDLLGPRVMELMLTWPELSWRVAERELLALRDGWGAVRDVVPLLELAADIMDAVPGFAWEPRRGDR